MWLTKVTTVKVNPHRTNLAIITDDARADYKMMDFGFTFYYKFNQKFKDTPLYHTNHYQLSQMLLSRLRTNYPDDRENGYKNDLSRTILEHTPWDEDAHSLYKESLDLIHTIGCIKKMNMDIIRAVIKDWGLNPDFPEVPEELRLKPHQLQSLALYIILGYSNNWGQMRTGKTPPTIIWAYALYLKGLQSHDDGVDTTVILCPNTIKHIHKAEIVKFTHPVIGTLTQVIEGTKKKKAELWRKLGIFKIVNYESLRADIDTVVDALAGLRYALVLDESHNVKNASQQTRAVQALVNSKENPPRYFCALSGTPVANKPNDVARVVQMTAPGMLGKSYDDFIYRYCYTGNYNSVVSYRSGALDEIRDQLARLSVRALRSEVNMDLGKHIEPQELTMSKMQEKVHNGLMTALRAELFGWSEGDLTTVKINSFLAQLMKLQQVTAGFIFDNNGYVYWLEDKDNPKLLWLDNFLDIYLDDFGKIVIACKFVPIIKKLMDRYRKYGALSIWGEVKGSDRHKAMMDFKEKEEHKVIIVNAKTAEGLDLNPATFMVQVTKDFQPKTNWQMEDRITGFNQVGESTIIPLLCEKSVDINLEAVLLKKLKWFDAVMGDEGKTTPKYIDGGLSITKDDLFRLVE